MSSLCRRSVPSRHADIVAQAVAYMARHRHEPLQVADIAQHVALSPKYLSHIFKQTTGRSPIAYLTKLRIEYAQALLQRGSLSIAEVAFEVGYPDVHYFTRVFVRHVGTPPGEYRLNKQMPEVRYV